MILEEKVELNKGRQKSEITIKIATWIVRELMHSCNKINELLDLDNALSLFYSRSRQENKNKK